MLQRLLPNLYGKRMVWIRDDFDYISLSVYSHTEVEMLLASFLYIFRFFILCALLQISGNPSKWHSMITSHGKWVSIQYKWWPLVDTCITPMMSAKKSINRQSITYFQYISFFEYFAYVFMFSNLLIGPIPCKSFIDFLRLEGDYKNIKYLHKPWLKTMAKACAFMVGEVLIRPRMDDKMF
jgi:hypothetical protein